MHRLHPCLAAAILTTLVAADAAAQVRLTAPMTNGQEIPSTVIPTFDDGTLRPASFGFASFILSADRTSLVFRAIVRNIDVTGTQTADLNDNLAAAHIHAGPGVSPGTTGPVVWGFFGAPFNDVLPNDFVLTPFANGVGGTFSGKWDLAEGNNTTLAAQIPNILGGRSYINFHTLQFPAGEIRGNLAVVPEPATVLLLGSGLAVVGLLGLRRRRGRGE